MIVKRFLVGILLFNSLILVAEEGTDTTKYCIHENCSIAIDLLNTCDSCLIIVGPELFDYSRIETEIEKAVLKLLWDSKVSNYRRITVGPLQMNYLFIEEYSDSGGPMIDSMFSLDFQVEVLLRFIDLFQCPDLYDSNNYYNLAQKYNSGSCLHNDCYTSSVISLKSEWTYYEFGNYLYVRMKDKHCFYEEDNTKHVFDLFINK
jgi:hypothetical protein